MCTDFTYADVFAPAKELVGGRDVFELRAKGKGVVHSGDKAANSVALRKERVILSRIGRTTRRDLSFENRGVDTTNAGRFSDAPDLGHGGALMGVSMDTGAAEFAAEHRSDAGVWNEAETDTRKVALDDTGIASVGEFDCGQHAAASVRTQGPPATKGRDPAESEREIRGLCPLRRGLQKGEPGASVSGEWSLFRECDDVGTVLTGNMGDRKQQRPAARDDDAFGTDVEAALDHGLEAARAQDAWRGPTRERQEKLACARGEDELASVKGGAARALREPKDEGGVRGRGSLDGEEDRRGLDVDVVLDGKGPPAGVIPHCRAPPYLPAGGGVLVDERNAGTA